MDPLQISPWQPSMDVPFLSPARPQKGATPFHNVLTQLAAPEGKSSPKVQGQGPTLVSPMTPKAPLPGTVSTGKVAEAYKKQDLSTAEADKTTALGKYKDDQLLSNPGGDHYYLDQKKFVSDPAEQHSFWGRLKKDISDTVGNVKNFFHNLLFGAKTHYRDENNQIQETKKKGFLGSLVDFVKDVGSALSFGAWRPDGEEAPKGFVKRAGFFFSKMKEALFGDLVEGVTGSVVNMGEDLLFAGWNLLETVPDATIGNTTAGRKATTAVFDNGQVVMDYLTDIMPSGEAWVRVHSPDFEDLKKMKAPIYHNLKRPERTKGDDRWQFIRNTPFRKGIETIGSIFMDVLSLDLLGQIKLFSDKRK